MCTADYQRGGNRTSADNRTPSFVGWRKFPLPAAEERPYELQAGKKDASFFNNEEKAFKAALKDIASRFKSAKAGNNTDSQDFYGYLLQYFKSKASKNELTLGPDKDMIAGAVKEFEEAMEEVTSTEESDPLFGTYREMATAIIARCKDKLPLA